ncbi:MAG: glycoside hydrolase family protein [Thermoleophilia bacterium]
MTLAGIKTALVVIAGAVCLAAVSTAAVSCDGGGAATNTSSTPAARHTFGVYSPGNLDEVPADAAKQMIDALGVPSYGAFEDYSIQQMQEMGVTWIRLDFWYNGTSFVEPVAYVDKLRAAGFEVVACARPLYDNIPTDLPRFQSDLRNLIQRYPWIKLWQVGNEPNISMANPDDFPSFFLAGSQVIRDTCPDCRILLAAVATRNFTTEQARAVYRHALATIAAQPGGKQSFDIFDMHFYGFAGSQDELEANILAYRGMLADNGFGADIEVWITETGTYTGQPVTPPGAPAQTEDQQAAELVRRFATALGSGLTRVSWARPYENYRYSGVANGFYDNAGLIYNGIGPGAKRGIKAGTRKEAWYAYRTMAAKVSGYQEVAAVAPGIYVFRFDAGRPPVYVAWDTGANVVLDQALPDSDRGAVTVTDVTGKETQSDTASISLDTMPIFVEPR